MDRHIIIKLNKSFEESACEQNGVEYWLARDLQVLLEYDEWRNFSKVIDKAKISCHNAGQNPADHFVDVNKMICWIKPEELPPEEDLKKLERRVKSDEKKLGKAAGKFSVNKGSTT